MPSNRTRKRGLLLALLVFPAIVAFTVKVMFVRFKGAGIDLKLREHCKPMSLGSPTTSFLHQYTGLPGVDKPLCALVAFFHNIMDGSASRSFLSYAIATSGPLILLPTLEAFRIRQTHALSYPVLWGFLMQTVTVGITFPIYWLTFILLEGVNTHRDHSIRSMSQAKAEAIMFGLIVGAIIPSVAMLTMEDTKVTAIWQAYPLYMSIAQSGHLLFRRSSTVHQTGSGIRLIQAIYVTLFVFSSSIHIATVWPILSDFTAIKSLLLPSATPLPKSEDMNHHLLDFLKWDVLVAYSSTALALIWFARNTKQVVSIILWYILAIPLLGFGAAIMGVAMWRDNILL